MLNLRIGGATFAVLTAVAVAPVPGQTQGTSILTLLESEGRLEMGAETRGTLSSSDIVSARENYLDAWSLEGSAGDKVVIDLVSDDFDAYLYVVGPGLDGTLADDDSGGGCNARVAFTFLENGTFSVVASSSGVRDSGVYTLRVSDAAAGPAYPCGSVNPAVLAALPTEGRSLTVGGVEFGQLTAGVNTIEPGRPAEAWAIEGRAGDEVTLSLESDAFDAYLYVVGPGISEPWSDDDGGGERNARLRVAFPADGTYTVVATVLGAGSGSYVLRAEEPFTLNDLDTAGRMIAVGETAQGMLSIIDAIVEDGRRAQAWAFEAVQGQQVTVELLSEDFDSFLYLVGPGIDDPITDDDGAGELNSRITHTFQASGTYKVIASALSASASGSFMLVVSGR